MNAQTLLVERGVSRSALARALGLTTGAVWQWRSVPAKRVIEVERVTGIPRHDLRPDLYPRDDAGRAA